MHYLRISDKAVRRKHSVNAVYMLLDDVFVSWASVDSRHRDAGMGSSRLAAKWSDGRAMLHCLVAKMAIRARTTAQPVPLLCLPCRTSIIIGFEDQYQFHSATWHKHRMPHRGMNINISDSVSVSQISNSSGAT